MAIAYWCILIAAALPYVWVGIAKASGERMDNRDPRGWIAKQTHPRVRRGNAAQLNAFEAFAPFAAGVLMGIDVIDHVILADTRYFSFREAGRL